MILFTRACVLCGLEDRCKPSASHLQAICKPATSNEAASAIELADEFADELAGELVSELAKDRTKNIENQARSRLEGLFDAKNLCKFIGAFHVLAMRSPCAFHSTLCVLHALFIARSALHHRFSVLMTASMLVSTPSISRHPLLRTVHTACLLACLRRTALLMPLFAALLLFSLLVLSLTLAPQKASAQNATTSGSWIVAGNWSAAPYPGANAGATATFGVGGLTMTDCGLVPNQLATMQVNGGVNVTLQGPGVLSTTALNLLAGTASLILQNGLTLAMDGGALNGTVTVSAGCALLIGSGVISGSASSITGAGRVEVNRANFFGALIAPTFAGTFVVASSTMGLLSSLTLPPASQLVLNGDLVVPGGQSLTLNTATNPSIAGTGRINGAGLTSSVLITNPAFNAGIIPTQYFGTAGVLDASLILNTGAAIALNGSLTLGSATAGGLLTTVGATRLNINTGQTLTVSATAPSPPQGLSLGGAGGVSVNNGGTLVLNSSAMGSLSGAGTIATAAGSVVSFRGGLAPGFNGGMLSPMVFQAATVNGTLELNNGGLGTLNIAPTLTMGTMGRLRMVGNTVLAGSAVAYSGAGSVLEYTGVTSATAGVEFPNSMTGSVELNKPSPATLTVTADKTISPAPAGLVFRENTTLNIGGTLLTANGLVDTRLGSLTTNGVGAANTGLVIGATATVASGSRIALNAPRAVGTLQFLASGQSIETGSDIVVAQIPGLQVGAGATLVVRSGTLEVRNPASILNAGRLTTSDSATNARIVFGSGMNMTNTGTVDIRYPSVLEVQQNFGAAGTLTGSPVVYTPLATPLPTSPTSLRPTLLYTGTMPRPTSIELPAAMNGNVTFANTGGTILPVGPPPANSAIAGLATFADNAIVRMDAGTALNLQGAVSFVATSDLQSSGAGANGATLTIGTNPSAGSTTITGGLRSTTGLGNLVMDRAGARLPLATPLVLTNSLAMLRGNVIASSTAPLELQGVGNNQALSGGSTASFVEGPFRRLFQPNDPGSGTSLFPVGRSGRYLPLLLSGTGTGAAPASATIEAFATYSNGTPGAGLVTLSPSEYWATNFTNVLSSSMLLRSASATTSSVIVYSNATNGTYTSVGGTFQPGIPLAIPPILPAVQGSLSAITPDLSAVRAVTLGNVAPVPVVNAIFPAVGGTGTTATLSGIGFTGASVVRIGGVTMSTFTVQNDNALSVTVGSISLVPTQATITVMASGGTTTSTVTFGYFPPPTIRSVGTATLPPLPAPASPRTIFGDSSTTLLVVGTGLGDANFGTGLTRVLIGGFSVQQVTILSSTTAQIVVGRFARSGAITIATPGGIATTVATFQIATAPTLTAITPSVGTLGTSVELTGTNLQSLVGVLLGGVAVRSLSVLDSTRAVATVGAGTSGTVSLVWTNGTVATASSFVFGTQPLIAQIVPNAATAGTQIRLDGVNLLGVTQVTIGGVQAAFDPTPATSPTQSLIAYVPLGTTGGTVTVRAVGGVASAPVPFVVLPSARIDDITPRVSTSGTVVTITGVNFATTSSVSIAGVTAASFTVLSSTQIVAVVGEFTSLSPSLSLTTGTVRVAGVSGVTTSTVQASNGAVPPSIHALSASTATIGTTFVVTGRFFDGVQEVSIGGRTAPLGSYTAISSTQISITIPLNATSGSITVRTAGGTATTTSSVTIQQGAFITLFRPQFGTVGAPVRILGGGFTGLTELRFGDIRATSVQVLSDTLIVATTPLGAQTDFVTIATPLNVARSPQVFPILTRYQVDSAALVRLYIETSGPGWTAQQNWLTPTDVDDWFGVDVANVDGSPRVTRLTLPANNLVGQLQPETMELLSALQVLNVSNNRLGGMPASTSGTVVSGATSVAFPPVTTLRRLQELRIAGNNFSGVLPDSLGAMAALRVLDASNNQFSGVVPATLCLWRQMTLLDLSRNQLTGAIPPCMAMILSLQTLNLSSNQFTGSIPREFGNLVNLVSLRLGSNSLTGGIPSSLGDVLASVATKPTSGETQATTLLQVLDVSRNQLSGDLPASLGRLRALEELNLADNRFTSPDLNGLLRSLTNLGVLNLSSNLFGANYTDSLPSVLASFLALRVLDLSRNRFAGRLQDGLFRRLSALTTLTLDSNRLAGELSPELANLPELTKISIADNRFTALPTFFQPRSVRDLSVQRNQLTFVHTDPNIAIARFAYAPQDSIGAPRDTAITLGTRVELRVPAVGDTTTRYRWFRGTAAVSGVQVEPVLTLALFSVADTGAYRCQATSRISPDLVLVSRAQRLGFIRPPAPTGIPLVRFPSNGSTLISTVTEFEWSAILNATQYDVEIATDSAMTQVSQRFSTAARSGDSIGLARAPMRLESNRRYFWRVRGSNPESAGPWSLVAQFITAPPGTQLSLSTVDFGRVLIDDVDSRLARVTNLSEQRMVIQDIVVRDSTNEFRVGLNIRGAVLDPNAAVTVPVSFLPRTAGNKAVRATVIYTQNSRADSTVTERAFIGRGGALGIAPLDVSPRQPLRNVPIDFDTVRVGRPVLIAARVINRSSSVETIASMRVSNLASLTASASPTVLSQSGVNAGMYFRTGSQGAFLLDSLNSLFSRQTQIAPGDTAYVILRCMAPSVGRQDGTFQVESLRDTVQTSIVAQARQPLSTDISMTLNVSVTVATLQGSQLQPNQPSQVNPRTVVGGTVLVSIAMRTADSARAALVLPRFDYDALVRFSRKVLVLPNQQFTPQAGLYAAGNAAGNNDENILLPNQRWQTTSATLRVFATTVVASDITNTPLVFGYFRWKQAFSDVNYRGRVFVEELLPGSFDAQPCESGGTRLVDGSAVRTVLQRLAPNPVRETSDVAFTLRESSWVTLSLVDMSGATVQTLVQGMLGAGEHRATLDLRRAGQVGQAGLNTGTSAVPTVPAGTYFLVLQTPTALVTERVVVER
jgi:Leucine-rich repeat (LRR) protein